MRIWSLLGPADLGSIDFATLERRTSPNDALACPADFCLAKADIEPPIFLIDPPGLRMAMRQVLTSETRLTLQHEDNVSLTDRYVQRSSILGFPDTIVVRYLERPAIKSTVAIYSRSQIGYSDLGVNRARITRWLGKLRQTMPINALD